MHVALYFAFFLFFSSKRQAHTHTHSYKHTHTHTHTQNGNPYIVSQRMNDIWLSKALLPSRAICMDRFDDGLTGQQRKVLYMLCVYVFVYV